MYIIYDSLRDCWNDNLDNVGFIYYDDWSNIFRFTTKKTASLRLVAILN